VADDEVLTARLEKLLNTGAKTPTEVINVGRTGSSTIREYDLYRLIARRFSPDVVVLAYFLGNDLREVVEEHDQDELRRWHPQGFVRRAPTACARTFTWSWLSLLSADSGRREPQGGKSQPDPLARRARGCRHLRIAGCRGGGGWHRASCGSNRSSACYWPAPPFAVPTTPISSAGRGRST
jgi:hypothetical protein